MLITNFFEFSELNESKLFYSPILRRYLQKMSKEGYKIANDLLELEGNDLHGDITFIDSSDDGFFTFNRMDKSFHKIKNYWKYNYSYTLSNLDRNLNDKVYNLDKLDNRFGVYSGGDRNLIRIGRFVKKFLPIYNPSEIEEFVNKLKSIQNQLEYKIELVDGLDIARYYSSSNYLSNWQGDLANSCMNNKGYFEIYIKNPESVKLLIMTTGGKLVARALIWKLLSCKPNFGFEYFMDRVYSQQDYHAVMMHDYANNKGWAYKLHEYIIYKGSVIKGDITMAVKIKKLKYESYPYLDTFNKLDYNSGILRNRGRGFKLRGLGGLPSGGVLPHEQPKIKKFINYVFNPYFPEW